jgi:hypothetical protein
MLAHAILIDVERASRAKRLHSIELDRHSAAESIDHTFEIRQACMIRTFGSGGHLTRVKDKFNLCTSFAA